MNSNLGEPVSKRIRPLLEDGDLCKTMCDNNENDTEQLKHLKESQDDTTMRDNEDMDNNEDCNVKNSNGSVTLPSTSDDDHEDQYVFPPDEDITEMLEEVEYSGTFPTVTERYFTPYYKIDVQQPKDDICILIHSNRICMLTLAPSHFLLQKDKSITKVDFKVSKKLDRASNKVSGKGKHGAQPLQENSNICMISCSDGGAHMIKCCILGKLVEVNTSLLEDPQLLLKPPHKGGYLAIILPNIKLLEKIKESLLTQEGYDASILKRKSAETVNI